MVRYNSVLVCHDSLLLSITLVVSKVCLGIHLFNTLFPVLKHIFITFLICLLVNLFIQSLEFARKLDH